MRILGTVASSSREVPNAPTIGTATDVGLSRPFNNGSPITAGGAATVTFTVPTFNGGLPITSYTVRAYNTSGVYQNISVTGASSPITITGLLSSTQYKYAVYATNGIGNSTESAFSNTVTATTVPQAPTIGTATRTNNTTVSLTFTAGATGGAVITSYAATSSPSISLSTSGTTSPLTVTGTYVSGQAYTFSITAANANGVSAASGSSNSVTPLVAKPVVTGGTLTSDATYYYRTFTANGTLGITNSALTADYVVIAGGGTGGNGYVGGSSRSGTSERMTGGGAGAGGLRYLTSQSLSATNYSVTIGAGGATNVGILDRTNGSNSSLGAVTVSTGGGGGGNGVYTGATGGSGGGGGHYYYQGDGTNVASLGGAGTSGQGNAGGNATGTGFTDAGAGGGGAGLAGVSNSGTNGGNGSEGLVVFGTFYAGGGGGGGAVGGAGGTGGGGNANGGGGAVNTGGGGGGNVTVTALTYGGTGGSGRFIIRYTKVQVD